MCGTLLSCSCPLQVPRPQATQVTHSPLRFAAALSCCVLLYDFLPAWWMDTVVECVPRHLFWVPCNVVMLCVCRCPASRLPSRWVPWLPSRRLPCPRPRPRCVLCCVPALGGGVSVWLLRISTGRHCVWICVWLWVPPHVVGVFAVPDARCPCVLCMLAGYGYPPAPAPGYPAPGPYGAPPGTVPITHAPLPDTLS